ncbi:glycoside hydrolase family 3 protein [Desulfocurvus sp. DL9XJH121]
MRSRTATILAGLFALLACLAAPASAADGEQALDAMTLEQKVGQLFCVSFRGPALGPRLRAFIQQRHVGGLILYDAWGNVENPAQVARLARDCQQASLAAGQPGLFLAVDQEGGPVSRLRRGFAVPPSNMAVGATGDPAMAALAARVNAEQLRAVGLNMDFAPVADVNSNPANPIIGSRSYGGDPRLVARFAAEAVRAYNRAGILSVAKHFPGHGDTGLDSHLRLPVADHPRARLDAVELPPFASAIQAGVPALMTAHVVVPELTGALPATLSPRVLTGLLRTEMGFDGLVFTDSMGMGAVRKHFGVADAALKAFLAGADVLLYGADRDAEPEDFVPAWEALVQAVGRGDIPMDRLDRSVARILRAKQRFGLLAPAQPDPALAANGTDTPAQREALQALARRSLVSGRDYASPGRARTLPLAGDEDVLVLWPGAPDPLPVEAADETWIMPLPLDPDDEDRARALDAARAFTAVAVFTSRADKRPGQAALVRALVAERPAPRVAAVSLDTPYDIRSYPAAPCWVAAFSSVPASARAVLDALRGRFPMTGTMPVDIPAETID